MNALPEELQEEVQEPETDTSWEVQSEDEFCYSSEESSDEEFGDEVSRKRCRQYAAIP